MDIFQIDAHLVKIEGRPIHCGVGKNGFTTDKTEGDNKTPCGKFLLTKLYYRADHIELSELRTCLPIQKITPYCGWSDDPNDLVSYNHYIKKPYAYSHEDLWRDDHVYDLIISTSHNTDPAVAHRGSAIFIHIARENDQKEIMPTAGCLSLKKDDLIGVISQLTPESRWVIPDALAKN